MSEDVLRSIDKRADAPRPRCEGTSRTERREKRRRGRRELEIEEEKDDRNIGAIARGAEVHMERLRKKPSLSYNKYDFSSRDVANTQNFGKLDRNIYYLLSSIIPLEALRVNTFEMTVST